MVYRAICQKKNISGEVPTLLNHFEQEIMSIIVNYIILMLLRIF